MKILSKETIAQDGTTRIVRFEIEAPDIAKKARPGQFIVVMVKEAGERIPLTVFDKDAEKVNITLIVQEIGFSTKLMGKMAPGQSQPSFDKQYVRDYLETLDWDKTPPGPELPKEIVNKTTEKYSQALKIIAGKDI
jgi:hypothetical protein